MADSEFKYWAFLICTPQDNGGSRRDAPETGRRCWGDWWQEALKQFSIPPEFVGQINGRGEIIPERIEPVYRDESELPDNTSLSAELQQTLAQSRCLVVVCSPQAARSRQVNEVVRYFKQLGRSQYILPIVVAGEPNASTDNRPGVAADDECFVPALRHPVQPDGTLDTTRRSGKHIYVDARHGVDGAEKREISADDHRQAEADLEMAKIQLIALLIGVGFHGLWRREQQRHFFDLADAQHQAREALDTIDEIRRQSQAVAQQTGDDQEPASEPQSMPRYVHSQIQEAQIQAMEARAQSREAQQQLEEFQTKVRETQVQLEAASQRALAAESNIQEAQRRAQEVQAQLEETRNQLHAVQNGQSKSEGESKEVGQPALAAEDPSLAVQSQLKNQLEEAREQVREAQGKVLAAENQARVAQDQVREIQNRAGDASGQVQAAQNQALEIQVLAAQAQSREAQQQVQEFQIKVQETQTQLEAASQRVLAAESNVQEAQRRAQEVQTQLEETRGQLQAARNAQGQSESQSEEIRQQVQVAQDKCRAAENQVQELQSQARSAQSQLEDQLKRAREQAQEAQGQVLEAQNHARAVRDQIREIQHRAIEDQDQIKAAHAQVQVQVQKFQSQNRTARRLIRVFALLAVLALTAAAMQAIEARRQRQAASAALAEATAETSGNFDLIAIQNEPIPQVLQTIGGAEQIENRRRSLDKLAAGLPRAEISEALAAAPFIANDQERSHFQKWLLVRLAWANPSSAMADASTITNKIVNEQGTADSDIYFQLPVLDNWMKTDWSAAFQWVCALPDADAHQRALDEMIHGVQAQPDSAARNQALKDCIEELAKTDLPGASALAESLPKEAGRDQVIIGLWRQAGPFAILDWANGLYLPPEIMTLHHASWPFQKADFGRPTFGLWP